MQPLSLLPCLNTGSQAARHPARQPGSEHIVGPEGRRVDNLRCVHMAEQSAAEEDWRAETKQVHDSGAGAVKGTFLIQVNVAFGAKQQLGAVPGNVSMRCDFFCSRAKTHF